MGDKLKAGDEELVNSSHSHEQLYQLRSNGNLQKVKNPVQLGKFLRVLNSATHQRNSLPMSFQKHTAKECNVKKTKKRKTKAMNKSNRESLL